MIKILCVGKVKEKFYRDAILEYQKRLSRYTKLEIIEVEDVAETNKEVILLKEKEKIMRYLNDKDYVLTLEIEGKEYDSVQLSKKIDQLTMTESTIVFIIGGSYGLHEEIKRRSNEAISFSKLTFPHQLFRVILLEQIYRSYRILNHESYHK